MTFPTIPKSTTNLTPGDFCFIQRTDGKYVPFAFLNRRGQTRSHFIGGVVNITLDVPQIDLLPPHLVIFENALLHIKCFKENNTPIVGNIREKIGELALRTIKLASEDTNIGAKVRVWGWKTIYKIADEVKN